MSQTPRTVCIIEDDESVRRALRRLMRSVGLEAEAFASAEEFLLAAGSPAPACLILDLHLPGLSGLELQARLKANGRDIPVVFITAYGDQHVREQALRAGALAFLEKPFAEQCLLAAVRRALHPSPPKES
jgi:FixJ family two-component response regulator